MLQQYDRYDLLLPMKNKAGQKEKNSASNRVVKLSVVCYEWQLGAGHLEVRAEPSRLLLMCQFETALGGGGTGSEGGVLEC